MLLSSDFGTSLTPRGGPLDTDNSILNKFLLDSEYTFWYVNGEIVSVYNQAYNGSSTNKIVERGLLGTEVKEHGQNQIVYRMKLYADDKNLISINNYSKDYDNIYNEVRVDFNSKEGFQDSIVVSTNNESSSYDRTFNYSAPFITEGSWAKGIAYRLLNRLSKEKYLIDMSIRINPELKNADFIVVNCGEYNISNKLFQIKSVSHNLTEHITNISAISVEEPTLSLSYYNGSSFVAYNDGIDAGSNKIAGNDETLIIKLTNEGNYDLNISDIFIDDISFKVFRYVNGVKSKEIERNDSDSGFKVGSEKDLTIPVGSSKEFYISFILPQESNFFRELSIVSNLEKNPISHFSIFGSIKSISLDVEGDLSFGNINNNQPKSKRIVVKNKGVNEIKLTNLEIKSGKQGTILNSLDGFSFNKINISNNQSTSINTSNVNITLKGEDSGSGEDFTIIEVVFDPSETVRNGRYRVDKTGIEGNIKLFIDAETTGGTSTTLASSLNSTSQQITLTDSSGFDVGDNIMIDTIEMEIVGKSGNTISVDSRDKHNDSIQTIPKSYNSGTSVINLKNTVSTKRINYSGKINSIPVSARIHANRIKLYGLDNLELPKQDGKYLLDNQITRNRFSAKLKSIKNQLKTNNSNATKIKIEEGRVYIGTDSGYQTGTTVPLFVSDSSNSQYNHDWESKTYKVKVNLTDNDQKNFKLLLHLDKENSGNRHITLNKYEISNSTNTFLARQRRNLENYTFTNVDEDGHIVLNYIFARTDNEDLNLEERQNSLFHQDSDTTTVVSGKEYVIYHLGDGTDAEKETRWQNVGFDGVPFEGAYFTANTTTTMTNDAKVTESFINVSLNLLHLGVDTYDSKNNSITTVVDGYAINQWRKALSIDIKTETVFTLDRLSAMNVGDKFAMITETETMDVDVSNYSKEGFDSSNNNQKTDASIKSWQSGLPLNYGGSGNVRYIMVNLQDHKFKAGEQLLIYSSNGGKFDGVHDIHSVSSHIINLYGDSALSPSSGNLNDVLDTNVRVTKVHTIDRIINQNSFVVKDLGREDSTSEITLLNTVNTLSAPYKDCNIVLLNDFTKQEGIIIRNEPDIITGTVVGEISELGDYFIKIRIDEDEDLFPGGVDLTEENCIKFIGDSNSLFDGYFKYQTPIPIDKDTFKIKLPKLSLLNVLYSISQEKYYAVCKTTKKIDTLKTTDGDENTNREYNPYGLKNIIPFNEGDTVSIEGTSNEEYDNIKSIKINKIHDELGLLTETEMHNFGGMNGRGEKTFYVELDLPIDTYSKPQARTEIAELSSDVGNTSTTTFSVSDASNINLYDILFFSTSNASAVGEIVRVTNISSNEITVGRGIDGSTAATHTSGDKLFKFDNIITKGFLQKKSPHEGTKLKFVLEASNKQYGLKFSTNTSKNYDSNLATSFASSQDTFSDGIGIKRAKILSSERDNSKIRIWLDVDTYPTTQLQSSLTNSQINIKVGNTDHISEGEIIKIDNEEMRVTSVGSNTLLMVKRAVNSTSASTHQTSSTVSNVFDSIFSVGENIIIYDTDNQDSHGTWSDSSFVINRVLIATTKQNLESSSIIKSFDSISLPKKTSSTSGDNICRPFETFETSLTKSFGSMNKTNSNLKNKYRSIYDSNNDNKVDIFDLVLFFSKMKVTPEISPFVFNSFSNSDESILFEVKDNIIYKKSGQLLTGIEDVLEGDGESNIVISTTDPENPTISVSSVLKSYPQNQNISIREAGTDDFREDFLNVKYDHDNSKRNIIDLSGSLTFTDVEIGSSYTKKLELTNVSPNIDYELTISTIINTPFYDESMIYALDKDGNTISSDAMRLDFSKNKIIISPDQVIDIPISLTTQNTLEKLDEGEEGLEVRGTNVRIPQVLLLTNEKIRQIFSPNSEIGISNSYQIRKAYIKIEFVELNSSNNSNRNKTFIVLPINTIPKNN